ncbi:hypothetical protein [Aeromicrobium sp. UC242_57]|uniref:hypothetical protein n=1 Tax=Aeromicrobium sp. UC242_57 TaxID=3374624 RepID=UPI0037ADB6C4
MTNDWNTKDAKVSIARRLREIQSLHLDLWAEALYRHSDRDMPGGDAMNMLGPIANVEAWQHRYEAAEAKAKDGDAELPAYIQDQLDVETHPLLVLSSWEDLVREERGQPSDLNATVPRAVGYLRDSLDWMCRVDTYDRMEWLGVDAIATDLARVQSAVENVLHAGMRVDRGADCLTCHQPLIHEWAGNHHNPKTLEDDRWTCKPCGGKLDLRAVPQSAGDRVPLTCHMALSGLHAASVRHPSRHTARLGFQGPRPQTAQHPHQSHDLPRRRSRDEKGRTSNGGLTPVEILDIKNLLLED